MEPSITHWRAAGGKLDEVRDTCNAFINGDKPEKINHHTADDIKELFQTLRAIVEFSVASIRMRGADGLEFREYETYLYARNYTRRTAIVLLRRDDVSETDAQELREWLREIEPTLPDFDIQYV